MATTAERVRSISVKLFFATLLVTTSLVASVPLPADSDTSQLYKITLKDGSTLVGTLINERPDSLEFRTGSGLLVTVAQDQVTGKEEVSGTIEDGEYKRYDPNTSRLFFGPTARPVHGGYFSTYEIFFPFIAFGIADVFTLAGGMTLVPGATDQLFYVAPKITFLNTEEFGLAGGLVYTNVFGEDEGNGGAGIAYGVTTFGSKRAAATLGLGFGFSGGEWAHQPVIVVGGEAQLSNSVALLTENWIPVGSDVQMLSFGIRFFGDHLSSDLAFLIPLTPEGSEGFPFMPWVGFCYAF